MLKSRCGIICDTEICKKAFGVDCAGCININQPFWGECDIKTCCESKKLDHCGLCSEFPCETLVEYANDKEHGDGGERIVQCRQWAENPMSSVVDGSIDIALGAATIVASNKDIVDSDVIDSITESASEAGGSVIDKIVDFITDAFD
jgi:hypothetical protein